MTVRLPTALGVVVVAFAALLPVPRATAQLPSDGSTAQDALALSQLLFPDGADTVVVARDDVPIDALTSGYVQGAVEGPLVLTPTGALSEQARAEIQRLDATSAAIMGGTAAVSVAVAEELTELGLEVTRYAGDTRFGTASAAAEALADDATTGIVARAYPAEGTRRRCSPIRSALACWLPASAPPRS